jgi:hypothetical protein
MYLLILVLSGSIAPQVRQGIWVKSSGLPMLVSLLNILIPLSWFAITVRVMQEESLVGDRQFWVTRPYRWQSLLAAKLLFAALCIWMPFLLMQCIMAMRAGLNPLNAGLLTSTIMALLYIWLPCMLLANAFGTMPPAFFSAIGAAVLWGLVLSFLVGSDEPRTGAPWSFPLLATIFAVLFFAALLWQYRTRDTRTIHVTLISSVVLFFALYMGYIRMPFHGLGRALMHAHYRTNSAPELHLAFAPVNPHAPVDFSPSGIEDKASFSLPIHLQGLDASLRLIHLNASYTLQAGSSRYVSPWRPVALNSAGINFLIPRSVLHDINGAGVPARFHLDLVGTTLAPFTTQTAAISSSFTLGPHGLCSRIEQYGNHIRCTFAYVVPDPIRLEPVPAEGCARNTLAPSDIRTEDAGVVTDPVRVELVSLAEGSGCPVSSVRAITYRPGRNFSTTLDIPSLWLDGRQH